MFIRLMLFFSLLFLKINFLYALGVAEDLKRRFANIHSFQANFVQDMTSHDKQIASTEGHMYWLRPHYFRWDTQDPTEQRVIADGQHIWIYDVDLEQVTIKKQKHLMQGVPSLFLGNRLDDLERDFDIKVISQDDHGKIQYYLRPHRGDDTIHGLQLTFQGANLIAIAFDDAMDQHTNVRLTHIKMNQSLSPSFFEFHRPAGVDIIDETQKSS